MWSKNAKQEQMKMESFHPCYVNLPYPKFLLPASSPFNIIKLNGSIIVSFWIVIVVQICVRQMLAVYIPFPNCPMHVLNEYYVFNY